MGVAALEQSDNVASRSPAFALTHMQQALQSGPLSRAQASLSPVRLPTAERLTPQFEDCWGTAYEAESRVLVQN